MVATAPHRHCTPTPVRVGTVRAGTVRVGDRERESTARRLGQAVAEGYFDIAEYERRVGAAFAADTSADLERLTADLPVAALRRHDPRRRAARRAAARLAVRLHVAAYLAMVAVVLTVWLAVALSANQWYFWPIWPIVGAGIGVLSHAIPVRMATRTARPIR